MAKVVSPHAEWATRIGELTTEQNIDLSQWSISAYGALTILGIFSLHSAKLNMNQNHSPWKMVQKGDMFRGELLVLGG